MQIHRFRFRNNHVEPVRNDVRNPHCSLGNASRRFADERRPWDWQCRPENFSIAESDRTWLTGRSDAYDQLTCAWGDGMIQKTPYV